MLRRVNRWFDDRFGVSGFIRSSLNKVFPDHWSFMLGEVALYSFVVLVLTGIFLSFFFTPSVEEVVYHGKYAPLKGVEMTEAYRSTVRLSFDIRAGLVMRQIHHWAALLFAAAAVAHLCRVFFTGAFRRPRELNWIIGVSLLVLVVLNGFTGYSLPDDLLSGTGLRIAYSMLISVPFVGEWLTFLFFGGEFPSEQIISRLFVIHILLVPLAILGLLAAHMAILWRQKHTQFPGEGRREDNVVGSHLWPTYAVKSMGLFAGVTALLAALGGLAQINPVWLYGPFEPSAVSTAAQPDWYLGWVEGALRIFPPWEVRAFGHTLANPFFPGILLPGLTFALLYAWPFLEAWVTRDHDDHHLLDAPRHRPVRTAIGVGVIAFYGVLTFAGGQDVFAQKLHVSVVSVVWAFRILLVVVPLAAALFAWKLCRDLSAADEGHDDDETGRGEEAGPAGSESAAAEPPVPVPALMVRTELAPAGPARPGGARVRLPAWRPALAALGGGAAAMAAWLLGRRRS